MPVMPSSRRGVCAVVVVLGLLIASAPVQGQPDGERSDVPAIRIAGADRVQTAELVAQRWVATGRQAQSVVIVPAHRTDLALIAAPPAGLAHTVVLLSEMPPRASTLETARSVGATDALVIGGGEALSQAWSAAGFGVTSVDADGGIGGQSAALARATLPDDTTGQLVIAGVAGLPDALAVGPHLQRTGAPLLITPPDVLDPHARFLIQQRRGTPGVITRALVVGGEAVVGAGVVQELTALGVEVTRIAGADREETAQLLAGLEPAPGRILLAAGNDPADGAAAASLAAAIRGVILSPGARTRDWLSARCGTLPPLTVLGGNAAITATVEAAHRRAAQRCDGPDDPLTVRLAVAVPADPSTVDSVVQAASGPGGWSSRRVRVVGVGEDPDVGLIIADDGCGTAATVSPLVCRRGNNLVIDGATWRTSPPEHQARLVRHLLGNWLGQPVASTCDGTVMAPLACSDTPLVTDGERDQVADRFVPQVTLAFAGDIHAERHLASAFRSGVGPLAAVQPTLAAADLAIVNLETPLSTRGRPAAKRFTFRGPPETAAALVAAGVDIATLANNHALDYGYDALADTLAVAADAGLATIGAGSDAATAYQPLVVDTDAGRIAFVGLTRVLHTRAWEAGPTRPGLASAYDVPAATAAVRAAADTADHVVVAIHWGTERADCPDVNQRALVPALVDAGADVIVGHHPHVLQGVQERGFGVGDGTLIAYSLGNFVWYHDRAPSRFTGVLQVDLPLLDDPSWEFLPAEVSPAGSPVPAIGPSADGISGRLSARSPGGAIGCTFG